MFRKINKWFEKNYEYIFGTIAIIAGVTLISTPEKIPDWFIILVGISWVLEGFGRLLEKFDR